MSPFKVAKLLLLDDDTIREWHQTFEQDGIDGLVGFHYGGRQAFVAPAQASQLKAWLERTLPRTTREVGAYMLDNARCRHAKLVKAWLSRPDCRIRLHVIPPYCPDLNPIERLWLVMHKALIHTRCAASFRQSRARVFTFLRYDVPSQWDVLCDQITENFRIRDPSQFRNIR